MNDRIASTGLLLYQDSPFAESRLFASRSPKVPFYFIAMIFVDLELIAEAYN